MESWRNELYHHGRLGQVWGVRNGPPYPLDRATVNSKYGKREETFGFKFKKAPKAVERPVNIKNLGKDESQLDLRMIKSINKDNHTGYGGERANCLNCSIAYIMNSLFDYPCTSKVVSKAAVKRGGVRAHDTLNKAFKNYEFHSYMEHGLSLEPELYDGLSKIKDGTTGILLYHWRSAYGIGGHAIIYEKKKGALANEITLIDPQIGKVFTGDEVKALATSNNRRKVSMAAYIDFSNASLMGEFIDLKNHQDIVKLK